MYTNDDIKNKNLMTFGTRFWIFPRLLIPTIIQLKVHEQFVEINLQ